MVTYISCHDYAEVAALFDIIPPVHRLTKELNSVNHLVIGVYGYCRTHTYRGLEEICEGVVQLSTSIIYSIRDMAIVYIKKSLLYSSHAIIYSNSNSGSSNFLNRDV